MAKAPTKSKRPVARPSRMAPKKSPRPKARPNDDMQARGALRRANNAAEMEADDAKMFAPKRKACGGKMKKMATGGTVRGMGAAKKGGKFSRSC